MSLIKESVSVSLVDNISANLVGINNSVEQTINHFNDLSTTINNTENSFTNINKNIKNTENHFNRIKNTINNSVDNSVHNISNIGTAIDESFNATNINATIGTIQVMNDEAKKSKSIFEEFAGCVETIKVGFGKLKQLADISDQMTANTTKLDAMNDGVNTTQELQDKVFASARRSGMAFDSMVGSVSGLSQATGGLFSNDEAIQFTENLSKLYSMAGTGQDEMTAGMSQFAQAMGSGSIGLDELNSVPGLMEAIANGAGVPAEKIAEMATAGRLSADAVKGSLLNATSEINSGFQETPATWASVLTMMKDDLLQFFAPILQIVNAGAQFIRDNWAAIEPVFFGAAIAVGIFAAAMGIAALVTSGFFVTLLTNPLTGIAILIALVAMDIYKLIQSVGGLQNAWEIMTTFLQLRMLVVKASVMEGIYYMLGLFDKLTIKVFTAAVAIANHLGDLKVSVLTTLQDMVNGAIDIINWFIEKINTIPGVNIEAVEKVTFAASAAAENEAEKAARNNWLNSKKTDAAAKEAERAADLANLNALVDEQTARLNNMVNSMKAEAAKDDGTGIAGGYDVSFGSEAAAGADYTVQSGGGGIQQNLNNNVANIANNTANTSDGVAGTEEELKYIKDLAEQEAINRFTTAEIKVDFSNTANVNSNMDIDGVMNRFKTELEEAVYSTAEEVHMVV